METKKPKFTKPEASEGGKSVAAGGPEPVKSSPELSDSDLEKVAGGRGIYTCGTHCATQVPTSTYLRIYMIYD